MKNVELHTLAAFFLASCWAMGGTAPIKAHGVYQISLQAGTQTIGLPLSNNSNYTGEISGASEALLEVDTELQLKNFFSPGAAYYVEIVAGTDAGEDAYIGHRFEVDESATVEITDPGLLAIDLSSNFNTLTSIPNLSGYTFELFPHLTLSQAFPPSGLHASLNFAQADQIQTYHGNEIQTYFLLGENGQFAEWRQVGAISQGSKDSLAVYPGQGLFFKRSSMATETATLTFSGRVRTHAFRRPLLAGMNFVSEGFPISRAPSDRVSGVFHESDDAGEADQIHVYSVDGYAKYYLESPGIWNLISSNDSSAHGFEHDFRRAVFHKRPSDDFSHTVYVSDGS